METTTFLLQAWGLFIGLTSFGFMLRPRALEQMLQLTKDHAFIIATGLVSLIIGILSILVHNKWGTGWEITVSILGWTALIKSWIRLIWPQMIEISMNRIKGYGLAMILGLGAVFGFFLAYEGWRLSGG